MTPPRLGPPCGCERSGRHEACAVDRARHAEALAELLAVLEPDRFGPDPCTGRCGSLGFDEVRNYAEQYGVCPCVVEAERHRGAS